MKKKPKILVVGSLVMDLIVSTEKFPGEGETVLGQDFNMAPGGKGANQAVQAALLGADVTMIGTVGTDEFGRILNESLNNAGVNTDKLRKTSLAPTAVGVIILTTKNSITLNNRIIVASGANMTITPEDISYLKNEIADYDMVMLQLEIPMEVNEAVAAYAAENGVPVMLNSAPYAPIPQKLLNNIAYISPNEYEASELSGIKIEHDGDKINIKNLEAVVEAIHKEGVKQVIVTLGDKGAILSCNGNITYRPCVQGLGVVDPTAAGDSFVSAFCTALSYGLNDIEALEFANYVAAITVSGKGAQPSLPNLKKVLELAYEKENIGIDLSLLDAFV